MTLKIKSKDMVLRSVRVCKHNIGYLRWLLESHDGLATPTTRDDEPDVVDLMVSPDFVAEFDELLDALVIELDLEKIEAPQVSPL